MKNNLTNSAESCIIEGDYYFLCSSAPKCGTATPIVPPELRTGGIYGA